MTEETLPATGPRGRVTEIFSSLQGEGLLLGERMIFVRAAGCPWRCNYCDTPGSLSAAGAPELSVEDALDKIHHLLEEKPQKWVSFTGGEPLNQPEFVKALMAACRRLDLSTYLETSGTQPEALARVIEEADQVSMDVKLPSAVGREFWEEHAAFLKVAGGKAFLKVVLTADTTDEELERAFQLALAADPAPAVVLQPATPIADLKERLAGAPHKIIQPPPPARLVAWWDWARRKLPGVKLIPQMHPIWGVP
jgi:7-carboxy-7-deazaguanine synthase